jgi:PEGA domain
LVRRVLRCLAPLLAIVVAMVSRRADAQPATGSSPTHVGKDAPSKGATVGHVAVHVTGPGSDAIRILVDGIDVGAAPWEGDLPEGPHQVSAQSSTASAMAQSIAVTPGSRTTVDLATSPIVAHLQVRTSDGKASIFVDGTVRGEGAFSGDVLPGPHTIVVTREGFERFERTIALAERQTWAEAVTLQPIGATGATAPLGAARAFEGFYGGVGLMGAVGVGGQGTELETNCNTLGAASCETPSATGGGLFGYVGWTWNPVGFELFLVGLGDQTKQVAHFTGRGTMAQLPASLPSRDETFQFIGAGGGAALRARASFQNRVVRGSLAGGVGFAYREIFLNHDVAATDGSGANASYSPKNVGYASPAISVEGAIQIRVGATIGIAVGLQLWADNASIAGSNSVPPAQGHVLSNGVPIPTPAYHLASGPQILLLPFVGIQFGP